MSYALLIETAKDLTLSSMFFLRVVNGDTSAPNSGYFYIEGDLVEGITSTLPSTVSSISTTNEASSTAPIPTPRDLSTPSFETDARSSSVPTSDIASAPTASNTPSISIATGLMGVPTGNTAGIPNLPEQKILHIHNEFSLGAKIGLGVGISVALFLGVVAGWLFFRRHQQRKRVLLEQPAHHTA